MFRRRTIRTAILVMILIFPIPLNIASAHTSFKSALPEAGSKIDSLPQEVVLAFDENLVVIGDANTVTVKDARGVEVTDGPTRVTNNLVSRDLGVSNLSGNFSVTYRVVANDGHVIKGSYEFNVMENEDKTLQEEEDSSAEESLSTTTVPPTGSTASGPEPEKSLISRNSANIFLTTALVVLILLWRKSFKKSSPKQS